MTGIKGEDGMAEGDVLALPGKAMRGVPRPANDAGTSRSGRTTRSTEFNAAAHGLRGVAAMMVFWGHLLGGTAKHIYAGDPSYGRFIEPLWHFGTAGVVLFFVISGFVILPSVVRYRPGQFALRRFLRLYPLFLVLSLVFVGLNAATGLYPKLNDLPTILAGLTFINIFVGTEQLTPNAWSLSFEVMFYALTCLVVYFVVHRPNRGWLLLTAMLCTAFVGVFPIALFFVGGIVVRLLHDRNIALPAWLSRPLELIALACFIRYASMSWFAYVPDDFVNPIALKIIASSLAYFALAVAPGSLTHLCLGSPTARYLGTVSYSLYLVHPYTYYLGRLVFDRMGLFTDEYLLSMILFFAAVTPVTLLVTHFVHRAIEMKPYEWFFQQKIYRAPVQGSSPEAIQSREARIP
jgi:peptidoglycan/LPS O-acetylase OafA/YrhL